MSDEILKLVRTVAGLPREDQGRLLRLVDLLSLAPYSAQQRCHRLLRELLDASPQTKLECVAGIDELIDFLEQAVSSGTDERAASFAALHHSMLRGTTQ